MVLGNNHECPLDCKEIKPVSPKEINPEYSLEELMLKLKLQYFGHLMQRMDSFEKTLMLGKTEGRMRRGHRVWNGWMASPTRWTWVWASFGSWWWTGKPGVLQSMGSQLVWHDWATELNWKLKQSPEYRPDTKDCMSWGDCLLKSWFFRTKEDEKEVLLEI